MEKEPTTHPDFGELDAYRTGEADATAAAHIDKCAECQRGLEELEEVVALVRRASRPWPAIPEAFNQKMLELARQHAARVRRELRRAKMQRWAIAATVLLSVAGVGVWLQANRAKAGLDVVDALSLARQLATTRPTDVRYDANHDGGVDRADLERIMRQAVSSLLAAPVAHAQAPPPAADFRTVDVIIDAGTDTLAAYQVEIVATTQADGEAEIVGVEGGEERDAAPFNAPPYYDRAALRAGRIILAAYSLDKSLPSGRVRVAVLHMYEAGTVTYRARLIAAARGDGSRFKPAVSAVPGS